jgi:hypothetical protein
MMLGIVEMIDRGALKLQVAHDCRMLAYCDVSISFLSEDFEEITTP